MNVNVSICTLEEQAHINTVRMISTGRSSVHILLLRHYKSNLAHISDRYNSVIGLYLYEMLVKII